MTFTFDIAVVFILDFHNVFSSVEWVLDEWVFSFFWQTNPQNVPRNEFLESFKIKTKKLSLRFAKKLGLNQVPQICELKSAFWLQVPLMSTRSYKIVLGGKVGHVSSMELMSFQKTDRDRECRSIWSSDRQMWPQIDWISVELRPECH